MDCNENLGTAYYAMGRYPQCVNNFETVLTMLGYPCATSNRKLGPYCLASHVADCVA